MHLVTRRTASAIEPGEQREIEERRHVAEHHARLLPVGGDDGDGRFLAVP